VTLTLLLFLLLLLLFIFVVDILYSRWFFGSVGGVLIVLLEANP